MDTEDPLREKIAGAYAPVVALCQLLENRLRETDPDVVTWAPHLASLRALRDGKVAGSADRLARLLTDPGALEVDPSTRFVELVSGPERTALIQELLAEPGVRAALMTPGNLTVWEGPAERLQGAELDEELRRLRRNLMWLEQWPRDLAALAAARQEQERREAARAAGEQALMAEFASRQDAVPAAEEAVGAAEEAHARVAGERELLAAEAVRLQAGYDERQATADAASTSADALNAAAETARERLQAIEERAGRCTAEQEAAHRREQTLVAELAQAEQDLPKSSAEAERLAAEAAEASGEAHARYYRLVAAESALAAERQRLGLGRFHVPQARQGIRELRLQATTRRREADEAAARARQSSEAAARADEHRASLAGFLAIGDQKLAEARTAQERAQEDLARLAPEIDTVREESRMHAQRAAEASEAATEALVFARKAGRLCRHAEEQLAASWESLQEAGEVVERARTGLRSAAAAVAETEAALERWRTEPGPSDVEADAELESSIRAEGGSRGHVEQIGDPGAIAEHQRAAMARIEELTRPPEQPQVAANQDADVDVLIVDGADQITDTGFLVAAIRARRWVLIGDPGQDPPEPSAEGAAHLFALGLLHTGQDAETVPERWREAAVAEAERLRDGGLWESRYREPYERALQRAGADELATALTGGLGRSLFSRVAEEAPGLIEHPGGPGPADVTFGRLAR
jgi:hypothetical protein